METKAGDPGAFAQFDLNRVETPAFVVDAVLGRYPLRGETRGTRSFEALFLFPL